MNKQHSPRRLKAERLQINWLLMVVAVLLVAVIGSSLGTANLMAQYTTSTTGTDSARVARYVGLDIIPSDGNTPKILDADTAEATYDFLVENIEENETAIAYDVVITVPSPLQGVALTVKNGGNAVKGTVSADGLTYTFKNVGSFAAGEQGRQKATVVFTRQEGAVNANWNKISIAVNAAQID